MKAYQYTSLTSVMLLDCWSIPCVIVLTWTFLKTKYGLRKLIGVGVCVAGLILVVFSDVHASDRASKNMLLFCHIWSCTIIVLVSLVHKVFPTKYLSYNLAICFAVFCSVLP